MREVCFILIQDRILRVYFGSAISIPDSRERWEIIWNHRDEITEIVHSHPGDFLNFSYEDLTTMEAVEAGTGKTFTWSIVTRIGFLSRKADRDTKREDSPWWLDLLRTLSYPEMTWKQNRPKASHSQRRESHQPAPCPVTDAPVEERGLLSPPPSSAGGEGEEPENSPVTGRNARKKSGGISPPKEERAGERRPVSVKLSPPELDRRRRGPNAPKRTLKKSKALTRKKKGIT